MFGVTMMDEVEMIFVNGDGVDVKLETTGRRIYWLRKHVAKIKQKDLAAMIGVAQSYMSDLEADKKEPSAQVIAKIADALHTTTDFLLMRAEKASPPEDAEQTFMHGESKQAADMIDVMYPELRAQALRAVKSIFNFHQEHAWRDRALKDVLDLIEADKGIDYRQNVERQLGLRPGFTNNSEPFPRDVLGDSS